MPVVYGHDEEVATWVAHRFGVDAGVYYSTIGVVSREGHLTGAFLFNHFTGPSIEMTIVGVGAMWHWGVVRRYVFEQLGCTRLQVTVRASNRIVRKLAPRFGFKFEGVARRAYGREHGLVYSLTVDDLAAVSTRWRIA